MPELLVVSSFQFMPVYLSHAARMPQRAKELLLDIQGVISYTAWQHPTTPTKLTTVLHLEDAAIADDVALTMSENSFYTESLKTLAGPADMKRVRVTTKMGKPIENTSHGDFLSVSHRIAEPGMADELEDELEGIFQELMALPGFIGSIHGNNESLAEELIGLAFWDDEDSFRKSLPKKMMYSIDLFRRIV